MSQIPKQTLYQKFDRLISAIGREGADNVGFNFFCIFIPVTFVILLACGIMFAIGIAFYMLMTKIVYGKGEIDLGFGAICSLGLVVAGLVCIIGPRAIWSAIRGFKRVQKQMNNPEKDEEKKALLKEDPLEKAFGSKCYIALNPADVDRITSQNLERMGDENV
jgi:hypothetical protein